MSGSLYGAYPKKLPVRFKLPSHLDLLRFQRAKVKDRHAVTFNKNTVKHQLLIPYFLRTWEQRWYLVAEPNNHHHGISIFALERMENIMLTKEKMSPTHKITAEVLEPLYVREEMKKTIESLFALYK